MKYEWRKEEKKFYGAKEKAEILEIPKQQFIMIDGLNKIWNKFLNFLEDKEMYKSYEGALISGVCSGLSKRFGISASFLRVLFLLASIFSFGSPILIYILLSIIMPVKPMKENYRKSSYIDGRAWEK